MRVAYDVVASGTWPTYVLRQHVVFQWRWFSAVLGWQQRKHLCVECRLGSWCCCFWYQISHLFNFVSVVDNVVYQQIAENANYSRNTSQKIWQISSWVTLGSSLYLRCLGCYRGRRQIARSQFLIIWVIISYKYAFRIICLSQLWGFSVSSLNYYWWLGYRCSLQALRSSLCQGIDNRECHCRRCWYAWQTLLA